MIKAILFDLDGTLLDTDKLIFMTYQHMFEKFNCAHQPTFKELISFLGPTLMEIFPRYFTQQQHILIEEYRKYNVEHHYLVQPIYGAETVLKKLKDDGYMIGIVTSKRKDVAVMGLNMFDLYQYIDFLVDCDMVTQYKPDPEGIEMALSYFNILAAEAIMVGDSLSDMEAGIRAGCKTAAVGYSLKGDFYRDIKIDYVLSTLFDIFKYLE